MSESVRFVVDLVSLTKPRLSSLVVFTAAIGILDPAVPEAYP